MMTAHEALTNEVLNSLKSVQSWIYGGLGGLNPPWPKGNPLMKYKMCAGGPKNAAQCERSEQKMYVEREFFKVKKV